MIIDHDQQSKQMVCKERFLYPHSSGVKPPVSYSLALSQFITLLDSHHRCWPVAGDSRKFQFHYRISRKEQQLRPSSDVYFVCFFKKKRKNQQHFSLYPQSFTTQTIHNHNDCELQVTVYDVWTVYVAWDMCCDRCGDVWRNAVLAGPAPLIN